MARNALCIGVSYADAFGGGTLAGTLRDVQAFSSLLTDRFGYNVRTMRDDLHCLDGNYPTRDNIMGAIYDLVSTAQQGDYLAFYFAGHGDQVTDTPGAQFESDRKDEAILPADYAPGQSETYIVDDDIRQMLVNPAVSKGAHIIVFDCCHSGTAADLDDSRYQWVPSGRTGAFNLSHPSTNQLAVLDSRAVSWAACPDPDVTLGNKATAGLFTSAMVAVLGSIDSAASHAHAREQVREHMVAALAESMKGTAPASLWARVAGYAQKRCQPQLAFLDDDPLYDIPLAATLGGGDRPWDAYGARRPGGPGVLSAEPFSARGPSGGLFFLGAGDAFSASNAGSPYSGGSSPYNGTSPYPGGSPYIDRVPYDPNNPFGAGGPCGPFSYNNDSFNSNSNDPFNAFNSSSPFDGSNAFSDGPAFDNSNPFTNTDAFDTGPSFGGGPSFADPGFGAGLFGGDAGWM
ncbi:hypothetical protein PHLGIDRAFT_278477 [Phlebiopsis gigantea 11061_1 CR5-6]|uniref:Peptidase C14 caspase domain-containing protein n=1 Tax=Phlebiopsis gigantea (strain 11061_1 CR5-6) TaxID=745531 RepID=A0A0C3NDX6_PHLG1|nr:hypothetical protein PHLGIDRAFT_278477 [Phlebiopsis gigantea 11061_1 CR5-6]